MTTLLVGSLVGMVFFVLQQGWPVWYDKADFPINGQYCFLINIAISVALYVGVSLLTRQPDFNMDRMLHRGEYAAADEAMPELRPTRWWQSIFGITPMFNRRDRITAYIIVGWFLFWLGAFVVGMAYGLLANPADAVWVRFWYIYLCLNFALLVGTTLWLGIGGIKDVLSLFKTMSGANRDATDDGTVNRH
jgi:SSS family solute:Na+ symporter